MDHFRCWTYETSLLTGTELSDLLPNTEYQVTLKTYRVDDHENLGILWRSTCPPSWHWNKAPGPQLQKVLDRINSKGRNSTRIYSPFVSVLNICRWRSSSVSWKLPQVHRWETHWSQPLTGTLLTTSFSDMSDMACLLLHWSINRFTHGLGLSTSLFQYVPGIVKSLIAGLWSESIGNDVWQ